VAEECLRHSLLDLALCMHRDLEQMEGKVKSDISGHYANIHLNAYKGLLGSFNAIKKSWGIPPIKQKIDTMAAFFFKKVKMLKPDLSFPPKLTTFVQI